MKISRKKIISFLILSVILSVGILVKTNFVQAGTADNMLFGGQSGNFQAATGLGNTDIRIIIGNVIRVILGFLGVIAVVFILYGGWLYMTSQGESAQIDKAKKVIISAVIGLVIVLMSFGIASFVISRLYDATGSVGGGLGTCDAGNVGVCGGCTRCVGSAGGYSWMLDTSCPGCGMAGGGTINCDGNALTGTCDPDNSICDSAYPAGTYFCDTASACTCQPLGGVGDPCDADPLTPACDADDAMCMADLHCETDAASPNVCTCVGAPIINSITPVGGFCLDASGLPTNDTCRNNSDCTTINPTYTGCDTTTPNGAPGNFVTISGKFFGNTVGTVSFWDGSGFTVAAAFPNSVNPNCGDTWQDDQIIVVVPGGAMLNGPIQVTRVDGEIDTTNNARGPVLPDFVRNTIERPGLCLARNTEAAPNSCAGLDCGYFDNGFNLQGILFNGAAQAVRFGNVATNIGANNVSGWTNTAVDATVPNLSGGNSTVFVEIDNQISNYLKFEVKTDYDSLPIIDYINPASGPIGQYITIFGSGFQTYQSGASQVQFTNSSFGTFNADGLDFPLECRDRWWNSTFITVKVPPAIGANLAAYDVTVTNKSGNTSDPEAFNVIAGDPGPGICLLDPANGPINQAVRVYGDNFGAVQGGGFVRFYNNVLATVYTGWAMQLASTAVPTGAVSGPVQLSSAAGISNALPFMVGYCSDDSQCNAGQECCGSGTYWSGICRPTGDCSTGGPTVTGYGWTFTTSGGPLPPPSVCGGYTNNASCLASGACPNSLGLCATRSNVDLGDCGTAYCNSNFALCTGACVYNNSNNLCQANNAPLRTTCDTYSTTVVPGYTAECRAVSGMYGGERVWQVRTNSCPSNSFPDINGWCTVGTPGTPDICDSCSSGFSCISGNCYLNNPVCPSGSTCNASNECIKNNDVCECCCRVGYGGSDCCYGLTCTAGDCGNDPINYGLCTGCRVNLDAIDTNLTAAEQSASDLACNCTGTYGKYCEIANPADPGDTGACKDATPCDGDVYTSTCDPDNAMCGAGQYCGDDCFCKAAKPCDTNSDPLDGCSATANCDATEYCDTSDCYCKPIPPCDFDDDLSNGCSRDNGKCPANMYCGLDCNCTKGKSCDIDLLTPGCDAVASCDPGYVCDTSDCTCRPDSGGAGDACVSLVPGCSVGYFGCGSGYDCLDNIGADCRCCCDPSNDQCGGSLTCWPNRGECTGTTRGLCCGCSSDAECTSGVDGCGSDTCCYNRPGVLSTLPLDEALGGTDVCRNPLISVEFDQKMNVSSFTGNVIVVGDYGVGGVCPNGTSYLVYENTNQRNFFARAYYKVKNLIARILLPLFGKSAEAYTPAASTNNYCAITGTVSGYNNTGSHGVLEFYPNKALDPNRRYYVIIKGDANNMDAQVDGVESHYGVGMIGNADLSANYTFNGKNYSNSYVWSFMTGSDICELSRLSVTPPSYLFQTAPTTQSYEARPLSADGQLISAVPNYNWSWSWKMDNPIIATVTNTDDPIQTVTSQKVEDGKTYVRATATILTDTVNAISTVGSKKTGSAQVFVMMCENPWPAFSAIGTWYPWRDNVEGAASCVGNCSDTNYELYYCRDSATAGTFDDLPAIVDDSTVVLGSTLRCSVGTVSCAGLNYGDACGTGTCVYNIFKEAYFFRENVSTLKTDLSVLSMPEGQGAAAAWNTISGVDGYKLYWGESTGLYPNYATINNAGIANRSDVNCVVSGTVITCAVTGLTNDKKYFFNLSSYTKVETPVFGEVSVIIKDTTAPAAPVVISALSKDTKVALAWGIVSDAATYVVYFTNEADKAATGQYPFYTDPIKVNTIDVPSLTNGSTYYFAVKAIDASGNESVFSNQVTGVPVMDSCGDGTCDSGECSSGCTADCGVSECCGIEACNGLIGEDGLSCPGDCGTPALPATCGNGTCDTGECSAGCTSDCEVSECCGIEGCNTGIGENSGNCSGDCSAAPPPPPPPPPP